MESTGEEVGDAHKDGGDPLENDDIDAEILAMKIPGEVSEASQVERTPAAAAVHEGTAAAAAAAAPASSGDGGSRDGGGDSASAADSECIQISRPTPFDAGAESTAADAHEAAAVQDEVVQGGTVAQEGQSADDAGEAGDADGANRAADNELEAPEASPVPEDAADATKGQSAAEAAVPVPGSEEADAAAPFGAASEAALTVVQEGSSPPQTSLPSPRPWSQQPPPSPSPPPAPQDSPKVEKEQQSVVESKSGKKKAVGDGGSAKVVRPVIDIPLRGPGKYGVWKDRIVDGVEQLRSYLVTHWGDHRRKLPMKGTSDINCYSGYTYTADQYSKKKQEENVLRWGYGESRLEGFREHLPGYAEIERSVQRVLEATFPHLAPGLGLHNGHILRQFFQADGGSGFNEHIDEADDASNTLLWLSVAIKLTDDPPGEVEGTWMQVTGFEPVMYGKEAGSVVMFLSRRPHRSMRTPRKMSKVLKLVLFYKFTTPLLLEQYKLVAPPPLDHTSPRPLSVLPSHEKLLRRACYRSFDECVKTLRPSWNSPDYVRVRLHLDPKTGDLPPYENPIYGICAEVCVRCPIPALPSVLVHLSDVLAIPVSPVQKLLAASEASTSTSYPVYKYKPDLIFGDQPHVKLLSPMAYVASSAQVNHGTASEQDWVFMRRGQYLSNDTIFVGAVQILGSSDHVDISVKYPYNIMELKDAEPCFIVWSEKTGMHLVVSIPTQSHTHHTHTHTHTHTLTSTRAQTSEDQRLFNHEKEIAAWDEQKTWLIMELYEQLFFIGADDREIGGRPMFDLVFLTTLRKRGVEKDGTSSNFNTDDAGGDDEELSDLASSFEDLAEKARIKEWQAHMTWCNRTLKKEMNHLEKIQKEAELGKLVPPVLCSC